jgi:hypothetical protein
LNFCGQHTSIYSRNKASWVQRRVWLKLKKNISSLKKTHEHILSNAIATIRNKEGNNKTKV